MIPCPDVVLGAAQGEGAAQQKGGMDVILMYGGSDSGNNKIWAVNSSARGLVARHAVLGKGRTTLLKRLHVFLAK